MELWFNQICFCAKILVPGLALWAVVSLYTQGIDESRRLAEGFYFGILIVVAGLTVRTAAVLDACWLVHAGSLGTMVVAGVMYRPPCAFPVDAMGCDTETAV